MAPEPLPTFATKETPRTGSCLCGAVQLKITGTPVFTNLCHCIDCQKATASLFIACATFKSEVSRSFSFRPYRKEDQNKEIGEYIY